MTALPPLFSAVLSDNAKLTSFILDHGVDVNTSDEFGVTAFMTAAMHGNLNMMKLLVRHGANVHLRTKHGDTAVSYAVTAQTNNVAMLKYLRSLNVNMDVKDTNGLTPLATAVVFGKLDVVKLLLTYGVRLNARTFNGDTALKLAVIDAADTGNNEILYHILAAIIKQRYKGNKVLTKLKNIKRSRAEIAVKYITLKHNLPYGDGWEESIISFVTK
jgi:ankyrin repeat protein